MKAAYVGLGILAIAMTAGCGSDDGSTTPIKQADFDHGATVGAAAPGLPAYEAFDYPPGPYGTQVGSVMAPMELLGWNHPKEAGYDQNALEVAGIARFYNPNGDKPAKLLWVNSSAVWCGPCNEEYRQMRDEDIYEKEIKPRGVDVYGTLLEDAKNPPGPATPANLNAWGDKYEVAFTLAIDPAEKTGLYFPADAFPGALLVETKGMTIVAKLTGGAITEKGGLLDKMDAALANLPP